MQSIGWPQGNDFWEPEAILAETVAPFGLG
jgi:hypothetical protein